MKCNSIAMLSIDLNLVLMHNFQCDRILYLNLINLFDLIYRYITF